MWQQYLQNIIRGDTKSLARCISLIENQFTGYQELLTLLPPSGTRVIGITGAPGAGKSTLVDGITELLVNEGKRVGILCVDPSSPFNLGAVLGDRIRMSDWYTNDNVFIRSLASRGSMGGLNPMIIEITDLMKAFPFDHIIVETVGVGQSEIDIAGLADITVVVVVPEGGDEVQTMKAGLMEVADIFVVNKADRPGADVFVRNLQHMLPPASHTHHRTPQVLKTVASAKEGIRDLMDAIRTQLESSHQPERRLWLLTEKAYQLIQNRRMNDIDRQTLKGSLSREYQQDGFNLYRFVDLLSSRMS